MNPFWIVRLGSLVSAVGIIWAVHIATLDTELSDLIMQEGFLKIFMKSGPMEICAIGVLIWLFGKWRSSVAVH